MDTHEFNYDKLGAAPGFGYPAPAPRPGVPRWRWRGLGKLLIIWGVLLPLITLPSTASAPYGVIPPLEISLRSDGPRGSGRCRSPMKTVVVGALLLVGVGLSFLVLPKARR